MIVSNVWTTLDWSQTRSWLSTTRRTGNQRWRHYLIFAIIIVVVIINSTSPIWVILPSPDTRFADRDSRAKLGTWSFPWSDTLASVAKKRSNVLGNDEIGHMNSMIASPTQASLIGVAVHSCHRITELTFLHFFSCWKDTVVDTTFWSMNCFLWWHYCGVEEIYAVGIYVMGFEWGWNRGKEFWKQGKVLQLANYWWSLFLS